ncbi:hypothetical protein [Paenibacillus chungangensis]|uniref:Uncharacterized protein n=1 Tax=Paenibacillus chungangensis TaxID=696535 RepID=A0ABW3HLJ1_9BACL
MKKLEGHQADVIEGIMNDGETIFEIKGVRYEISTISEKDMRNTTVKEDVESDPELMEILMQAKRDIQSGNYYTSDEMREMIRRGDL